jgi:hypothetical protein
MSSRDATLAEHELTVPRNPNEPVVLRLEPPDARRYLSRGADDLAVFVGGTASFHDRKLPLAGRYELDGDMLTFTPTFGFVPGQDYPSGCESLLLIL